MDCESINYDVYKIFYFLNPAKVKAGFFGKMLDH